MQGSRENSAPEGREWGPEQRTGACWLSGGAGELGGPCHRRFGRTPTCMWVLSAAQCLGERPPPTCAPLMPTSSVMEGGGRAECEGAPDTSLSCFPVPPWDGPATWYPNSPASPRRLSRSAPLLRGAVARWPIPPCPSSQVESGVPTLERHPAFRSVRPVWVGEPAFLVDADAESAALEKLPVGTSEQAEAAGRGGHQRGASRRSGRGEPRV